MLVAALRAGWGLDAAEVEYLPVGFGSHHWCAVDRSGVRWFVTVDDLDAIKQSPTEPNAAAHARLAAALDTVARIAAAGCDVAVAPIAARGGGAVRRLGQRHAVAVYPFVDGRTHEWGDELSPTDRDAVLDLLIALHQVDPSLVSGAPIDAFVIPHRNTLADACHDLGRPWDAGPFAERTRRLLLERQSWIDERLSRHDELVTEARARPERAVLTHGEPHPGNTIRTADGWKLIDWDTVRLAPPERDLWLLDRAGDPIHAAAITRRYESTTGVAVLPSMLALYRLRWQLADIANYVAGFRRAHDGDANDHAAWTNLVVAFES
jgi:spectinomycin phosphotransferase/16S rRNA (guanine(1405)-N(7))-methyltransferase